MNTKFFIWLALSLLIVSATLYSFLSHTETKEGNKETIENKDLVTNSSDWITYKNTDFGFEISHPDNFTLKEHYVGVDPNHSEEMYIITIANPLEAKYYLQIEVWSSQNSIEKVKPYFSGPYPRTVGGSRESNPDTLITRTLNGLQGVETYGGSGGGMGVDDTFLYITNKYLLVLRLNPILEGRVSEEMQAKITSNDVAKAEASIDKDIYQKILGSFKFTQN